MKQIKPRFSGHQTFVFRYGWLEKAYRFIKAEHSFTDENAIVKLGVGKNMVDSIRYWSEVTDIIDSGNSTKFGRLLLDEEAGWDPYLEDIASLWLLHWKLNTNPQYLHSGTILFSHIHKPEFSKREVIEAVDRIYRTKEIQKPADNMLNRDIDCYLRLYVGTKKTDTKNREESIGSPMEELNLIQQVHGSDLYRFNIGHKLTLSPYIIGYAIWEFMRRLKKVSITIQEALYTEYSPGQLFMLDENSIIEAVEFLGNNPSWANSIGFSESAGIMTIFCSLQDGNELLIAYYETEEML